MDPHDAAQLQRTLRRHLQSWQRAGVSSLPRSSASLAETLPAVETLPVTDALPAADVLLAADVLHAADVLPAVETMAAAEVVAVNTPRNSPEERTLVTKPAPPSSTVASLSPNPSLSPKHRVEKLTTLSACVADCRRCTELADARENTVFGVGDANAQVMFIGEAPGADEDKSGVPFVGRAGKLLDKIIEAGGWKREELYICNILKCRPPGNRNPDPTEAANCREYLDAQIAAVAPEYIVCWGSVAAKNLLDSKEAIGRMRKKFFSYGNAKVLCTYHPSYLLRNPAAKKEVWDDMKFLLQEMGLDPDRATK